MTRKPYPTDLTDDQWEWLGSLLPKPKSGTREGGRPATDLREVVDAPFHHLRGGSAWRLLPHDFPSRQTVYGHFRAWRDAGAWEAFARCVKYRRLGKDFKFTTETSEATICAAMIRRMARRLNPAG